MTEKELREQLDRIDKLRDRAGHAESMHKHWMGSDTELVVEHDITVRRRWRSSTRGIHSEYVMTSPEIELFRSWLMLRVGQLRAEADEMAARLGEARGD